MLFKGDDAFLTLLKQCATSFLSDAVSARSFKLCVLVISVNLSTSIPVFRDFDPLSRSHELFEEKWWKLRVFFVVLFCFECEAVITVKHTLIEFADLLEVRKKYFEERALYSLFRNLNPEKISDSWKRLVCSVKYKVFWRKFCVEKCFTFSCDIESLWF